MTKIKEHIVFFATLHAETRQYLPNPKGFDHNMWKTWQMWHSKIGHLPQFGIENQHVAPVLQMWQKKKKNKGFVFLKRNVNFVGRKLIKSK